MRFRVFLLWVVFSSFFAPAAMAGNLDSPGLPSAGSGMYTLQGLYDYLLSGVTPSLSAAFLEPSAGPGSTGKTTKEIYDGISAAFNAADATPDKVLSGSTFFSTDPVNWGPIAGTLATQTPDAATVNQAAGFYNAFDLSAVDTDLAAGNIRSGAEIFGVSGDPNVVDTSSGDATSGDISSGKIAWVDGIEINGAGVTLSNPAPVEKTGQTTCWDAAGTLISCTGSGLDGEYQKGIALPSPRFTDNGDGTVMDNMTGLIWLKNANCPNAQRIWSTAVSDVSQLNTDGTMNSNNCGDTSNSGSHQIDWRLPNVRELHSLVHFGYYSPALSNAAGTGQWTAGDPFNSVQSSYYWSSTTGAVNTSYAWYMFMSSGGVNNYGKTTTFYVWPVRGGQ